MLFVELGREVSPRNIAFREHRAVIIGIINNKFVVVMKVDGTSEVIRLRDIVLNDKVYSLDELKNKNHEFFKVESKKKSTTDFDRFKQRLEEKVVSELLKNKGISN
jgi:hypothetical protein